MSKRTALAPRTASSQTPLLDHLPALDALPTNHMRLLQDITAGRFEIPRRTTDGVARLAIIPAMYNFGGEQSRDIWLPKLAMRINIRGRNPTATNELIVRFTAWLAQQAEQFERELLLGSE